MKAQSQRIMISSARKFINMGALSRLWNLVKKFHAADIASLMVHLISRERLILFNTLYEQDREIAAQVMSELDPEDAAQIIKNLPPDQIVDLMHRSEPDDAASVIHLLPGEMKASVPKTMAEEPTEEVMELLHYEEETAGRIMSTNFYALAGSVNLLTMCTDSIGLFVFLGLGTVFLKHLT